MTGRSEILETSANTEWRGHVWFDRGLLLAARESCEKWCARTRVRNPQKAPAALNALGAVYIELGLVSEAVELFQDALKYDGSDADGIRSLCNISLGHYLLGAPAECVAYAEEAYSRADESGMPVGPMLAHVYVILGVGYIAAARWNEARAANMRARDLLEGLGDRAGVAKTMNNLGLIHVEMGEHRDGERLLSQSLALMEKFNDVSTTAYTYTELGRLYHKEGDLAAAIRYGSRALRILWDNMGIIDRAEVARLCELFGSIAHTTGDRKGALNYMQRATTYYAQQGLWREWGSSTRELDRIIHGEAGEPRAKIAIDMQDKQLLRYFTTLLGLMDTLECLYPALRGKSELVTKYSLLLGEACGIDGTAVERLSHAARLHDIGLTSMEVGQEMNAHGAETGSLSHPLLGERVLEMFGVPGEVRQAVRHHHEFYDGSGLPDHLQGEEIPIFSRIIALADAYVTRVTMTDDPKRAHTHAMESVAAESGRRFDPAILEAFVALHRL